MSRPVAPWVTCLCCCLAWGSQYDSIRKDLTAARKAYEEAVEKLRKRLLDALSAREKAARDKGDKKAVDAIKADREKLKTKGEPPWSMLPAAARTELRKARGQLESAYQRAIREYTKVSKDAEATEAEKALDEFRRTASIGSPFAPRRPAPGLVKEGAIYEGSFRSGKQLKSGGIGKSRALNDTFTLVFKSIDGENFVGEWAWGKGHVTQVEGTLNKNGHVRFQFTKNLKGVVNVLDGVATGTIDQKSIRCQYAKKSEEKIGVLEGRLKEPEK